MSLADMSSDQRANLIRQMARQGDARSRSSVASSVASDNQSVHDYDTISQQLPSLHDTPQNHPLKAKSVADFQINTSALRRAFPNFSQYGSSEEDSIELGRGFKRGTKTPLSRGVLSEDISEDLSFSLGDGGNYKVTGTPPLKPRASIKGNLMSQKAGSGRSTSHKENVDPLAKKTYISESSGKGSQNGRSSLTEAHARVESDDSVQLNGGRPQAATNNSSRNTRFTNSRTQPASGTFETKSSKAASTPLAARPSEQTTQQGMTTDSAVNATVQSFMLPDLPNITELVSGVRADGTPLFNRSSKPRSRFATPSQARRKSLNKPIHIPIDSIPVPADEKALYLSLQLLQEKVATLEKEKAESEKKRDDYELEVLQLKSKLEEEQMHRRSDSGLGTDADDVKLHDWRGERTELERSIRTLGDRLERADRKVSVSEITIRNLTQDRDAAHEQLAAAYLNSEELKHESDELLQELENVKAELVRVTKSNERTMERLTQRETELRLKIARREKAVNEMGALAKELWSTRNALAASNQDVTVEDSKETVQRTASAKSATTASLKSKPIGHERWHSTATLQENSNADANISDVESTTDLKIDRNIERRSRFEVEVDLTKDSAYLTFMEGDEVSKLRRILEEDKAKLAKVSGSESHTARPQSAAVKAKTTTVPRKSSLKSMDTKPRNQRVQYEEEEKSESESENQEDLEQPLAENRETQHSQISQPSERRRRSAATSQADMTSAYIVPDITLHSLSTINIKPSGSTNMAAESFTKQTMLVTRPIPVSDRMPVALPGDEDPTVRPVQSPAIALAIVLKGLEDELIPLRAQLVAHETLYHQHDPSLGKRQRKAVFENMQRLMAAIELRSDQIYALYDVLEGQKARGDVMAEDEVEVTLQNIGVDVKGAIRWASTSVSTQMAGRKNVGRMSDYYNPNTTNGQDQESDEDDDELPWQAFNR